MRPLRWPTSARWPGRWASLRPVLVFHSTRPPDELMAPGPPRPAATAATAGAAASTRVPMRAVAEATAAFLPRRRGVDGSA